MLRTVKRILLSLSVVILFALYAFQQQMHPLTATTSGGAVAAIVPTSTPPEVFVATTVTPIATVTDSPPPTEADIAKSTPTETPPATEVPTATDDPTATTASASASGWKDGSYTGDAANADWGDVQVQVTIAGGQITDVTFLTYPNHRNRSVDINDNAMPILVQETIAAQSDKVDIVSGATDTSDAFVQSLDSALRQAAA